MAGLSGERPIAVRIAPEDNVATLLAAAGPEVEVAVQHNAGGRDQQETLAPREPIPTGHKIALEPIGAGDEVRKYGIAIGRARVPIAAGAHVHVHNVESLLGAIRGPEDDSEAPARTVDAARLRAAIVGCLRAVGVSDRACEAMGDALVEAHLRGVETHGVRRLEPYIRRLRAGGVDPGATPKIEAHNGVLRVDGRNAIGHYVATTAADALRGVAREHGLAVALVRDSNHFGFAGYYATRIAQAGLASLVTSNGQIMVGPEGATRPLFSNDPVAIACPLEDGSCFELDMAFSATSRAKLVEAARRGEAIPPGIALNASGAPTTDASEAAAGILLPFGGQRGFALLTAVEMLTGVLGGGAYADQVLSKEASETMPEGTSHLLLAIDLEHAGGRERFIGRMKDLIARIHGLPRRNGSETPRYPGERRWQLRRERLKHGIPLANREAEALSRLCRELEVEPCA